MADDMKDEDKIPIMDGVGVGENKSAMTSWFESVVTNPIKISVFVFGFAFILVTGLTVYFGYYGDRFRENLLVEAHGTLFDILLLGVFVVWLQQKGTKRILKQRYQEEIDDYRSFESEEAARKIRGNIRRLNKRGITSIDLSNCYLRFMDLRRADLRGSDLWGADFRETDMRDVLLCRANLEDANFSEALMRNVDFRESMLWKANLKDCDLRDTVFAGAYLREAVLVRADLDHSVLVEANLWRADLSEANLWRADLEGANLEESDVTNAHFRETRLKGVKGLPVEKLLTVRTLYRAELDESVRTKIKKIKPSLLEEPVFDEEW